jgi:V/A-type H+-transporting ATPase subunit I
MGWVPSGQVDEFSQRIWEVSKDILVETYVYKRGHVKQDVPVALHNPRILRPFQLLVTTYAQPRYEELDPTFLLAITFPLLFGAMFGDVGHGLLLLTLGSLLASRMIKALSGLASLGGIVAACGVSAIIFGLFYGNLFGFENIIPALVIRPVNSTLLSMVIAISMGVVLLSLGFIVNIINSWTRKDFAQLLFSPRHLPGLVLYLALVGVAAEVIMGKTPIPLAVFFLVALIAAVVAILSELLERLVEKHNPLIEGDPATFFVGAFFELFETLISLLSNSISFVRVAAFAVAHAGLSAVFFILANLVSPAHGTGYWVMVIIGNLFIVGFEGMIVAIQTMRLEYYEFFSKFFSGGGMRYEPLTLLPKAEK